MVRAMQSCPKQPKINSTCTFNFVIVVVVAAAAAATVVGGVATAAVVHVRISI
jgi:hypothetical protein